MAGASLPVGCEQWTSRSTDCPGLTPSSLITAESDRVSPEKGGEREGGTGEDEIERDPSNYRGKI